MTLCLGLACALLVIAGLVGPLQSAAADLPPRPTPATPSSTPTKPQEPAGAWIELRVYMAGGEPVLPGQELWTTVQWQDAQGMWHDVKGWRGTLDRIAGNAGLKVWWVAQKDFGTGPFRWIVQHGQAGAHLAGSKPFTLPDVVRATLTIEVLLAP